MTSSSPPSSRHLLARKAPSGVYLSANEDFCAFVQKNLGQVLGRTDQELFPAEQAVQNRQIEEQALRLGRCVVQQEWLQGPGGKEEFLVSRGPAFVAPEDDPELVFSALSIKQLPIKESDFSDGLCEPAVGRRTLKVCQLAQEQAPLKTLLQQVPVGIVVADAPSGQLVLGNAHLEQLLRHAFYYSRSVEDYSRWQGYHLDGRPYQPEEWPMTRAIRNGELVQNERIEFVRGDQSRAVLSISACPLRSTDGTVLGGLVLAQDITGWVQTEKALTQSEQRFRDALDLLMEAFGICTAVRDNSGKIVDFRIDYLNASARVMGLQKAELGHTIGSRDPAFLQSELFQKLCDVVRTGQPFEQKAMPLRFVGTSEVKLIEYRASRLGDGFSSCWRDVTAMQQSEKSLQLSEERHRMVLETVTDFAFSYRVEAPRRHKLEWMVGAYEAVSGRTLEEQASLQAVLEQIHPEDRPRFLAYIQRLEANEPAQLEHRVVSRSGQVRWLRSRAKPIWNPETERVEQIVGGVEDITDLKAADAARLKTEALLAEAQRIARLGSFEWDIHTVRVTCSQQLSLLTGIADIHDLHGLKQVYDQVVPEDQVQVRSALHASFHPAGAYQVRFRYQHPDGMLRCFRSQGHTVLSENGQGLRLVGIVQDITEEARAEQERLALETRLKHAEKLESLAVLAGGIAHDFNNLLVGVIGNAELTLMELDESSPLWALVSDIRQSGLRAAELSKQMLAYSGRGRFVAAPVQLNLVVEKILQGLQLEGRPGLHIQRDLSPQLPMIEADAPQLEQLVLNLLTNALEALSSDGGRISISTELVHATRSLLSRMQEGADRAEGWYLLLSISDTGAGIAPEVLSRVFEPFFTTKFTGRGLGLAVVLGIIRGHKGAIRVDSKPSKGTTIQVLLPWNGTLFPPVEAPTMSPSHPVQSPSKGVVLVVDDEDAVRTVTRRMLQRGGFEVLLAADGTEALQVFEQNRDAVCAVLLDLTMPVMGGLEVFQALRAIRADIPVLLASGYSEQEATAQFAGLGLAGFISKPFAFPLLIQQLEAMCRKSKAEAQEG